MEIPASIDGILDIERSGAAVLVFIVQFTLGVPYPVVVWLYSSDVHMR